MIVEDENCCDTAWADHEHDAAKVHSWNTQFSAMATRFLGFFYHFLRWINAVTDNQLMVRFSKIIQGFFVGWRNILKHFFFIYCCLMTWLHSKNTFSLQKQKFTKNPFFISGSTAHWCIYYLFVLKIYSLLQRFPMPLWMLFSIVESNLLYFYVLW